MNDFTDDNWTVFKTIFWKMFDNAVPQEVFRDAVRKVCLRYKRHARASLLFNKARYDVLGGDKLDLPMLVAVEKEFPVDPVFADDFREAMIQKLDTSIRDEADLSRLRTQVLWDCCTRYVIKIMPGYLSGQYQMPKPPLYSLRSKCRPTRNQVTIEDEDAPDPVPPPASEGGWSAETIRAATRQQQCQLLVVGDLAALDAM